MLLEYGTRVTVIETVTVLLKPIRWKILPTPACTSGVTTQEGSKGQPNDCTATGRLQVQIRAAVPKGEERESVPTSIDDGIHLQDGDVPFVEGNFVARAAATCWLAFFHFGIPCKTIRACVTMYIYGI